MVVRGRNEMINYEDKKEDATYKVSCSRSKYDMIRIFPPRETNKQTRETNKRNKQTNMPTRRKTVITAQVKTTQEFCTSSATVAAFSLPVLVLHR